MDDNKRKALSAALGQIEKQFGKGAVMRMGDVAATRDADAISTGSLGLDIALGIGGLPRGRVVEIYGPESSGKTTLTLHAIAEVQKTGGVAAFIDAEHALDVNYARRLGVNVDELLASPDPAILWEMTTCSPAPKAPMWDVAFMIGAKTKKGAGYVRMSLLEAVTEVVKPDQVIPVHDYTGAVAGPQVGFLTVTMVDLDPEQGGRFEGVRLVAVRCKGLSW